MTELEAIRRKIYPEEKREDDRAVSPYIYYCLRPISLGPTLWLHRLGVTATGCTLLSALVMLVGALLLVVASASPYAWGMWLLGALLINVYLFLDTLDGNIARLTGTSSKAGEFLDCTLNAISGCVVPAAVGLGLYLAAGDALAQFLMLPGEVLLAAGFATGVLRLFRRVVTDHVSRLVGAGDDRANVLGASRKGPRYWASMINSATFPALLVACLLAIPSAWLLGYLLFNVAVASYTLYWAYRRVASYVPPAQDASAAPVPDFAAKAVRAAVSAKEEEVA